MNKQNSNKLVSAAVYSLTSGKVIGPYFLGISLEAIEEKYGKKINLNTLEIKEISVELIRDKIGFKIAKENIEGGGFSAYMFER